jgi:hypothetical protein
MKCWAQNASSLIQITIFWKDCNKHYASTRHCLSVTFKFNSTIHCTHVKLQFDIKTKQTVKLRVPHYLTVGLQTHLQPKWRVHKNLLVLIFSLKHNMFKFWSFEDRSCFICLLLNCLSSGYDELLFRKCMTFFCADI